MSGKVENKELKKWMVENYVMTSASAKLHYCHNMRGAEYLAELPLTVEVIDALTVLESHKRGMRLRFRATNSEFYRVCAKNGVNPEIICSTEYMGAMKAEIAAMYPEMNAKAFGMGHAFEYVDAKRNGYEWHYDCLPYYMGGDIVDAYGDNVQCKRKGASIAETSIHSAMQALMK
jgi:hypothetical protein